MVRRAAVGVSRRAGARVPDLRAAGLHRQRARRSAARAAGPDRRRAARQPAEPARAAPGACSPRRLAGARAADRLARRALRLRRRRPSTRTIAPTSTIRRPGTLVRSAPATCRAAATRPIATTSRRASASPGALDELQRWVVRGGYGIYYNQGALATSEGLYFNPPYFNLSVYLPGAGLPPLTLADPFPANFPVFIPQSATAYQRDLQTPWMEHWNVNVQRQIGRGRAIEVALRRLARPRPDLGARPQPAGGQPRPSRTCGRTRCLPTSRCIESRASSSYNALQVKYQQRIDAGLSAARQLHLRQVDRRRVGVLHERGRSELSAEQPRPRRRAAADRASTCGTGSR